MRYWWAVLLVCSLAAHADLYRWVDENGKVQFSDKPPAGQAKGVTQIDKQGRAIRSLDVSPQSEAEKAAIQEKQRQEQEQRRRDRALMQSFSKPEEIDLLRDRQIESVLAIKQSYLARRKAAAGKLAQLQQKAGQMAKAKKPVPDDLQADIDVSRKDVSDLDAAITQQDREIADIRARAEVDKQRLLELQGMRK